MVSRNVLVFTENSRAFGKGVISGIARYAKVHGSWDFFTTPGPFEQQADIEEYLQYLEKSGIDGIITRVLPVPQMQHMIRLNVPIITIPHMQEFPHNLPHRMVTNCEAIAQMAAEYYIDRGFKNFACSGFSSRFWAQNRKRFFQERLEKEGFLLNTYNIPERTEGYDWIGEWEKLARWLKQLPKPTALFADNDDCGLQVIEACRHADIKVPEEISIMGVDNDHLVCELSCTGLSSVVLATVQAGYEAAELLERLMEGEQVPDTTIVIQPKRIVTRASSDIFAINDPKVARAMQYIRKNSRANIKVEDVAKAAMSSRRVLERSFKRILGTTIGEEIKRQRVEQICELLIGTDLSIREIAEITDFETSKHISRYFSQIKGMNLQEFRKAFGKSAR